MVNPLWWVPWGFRQVLVVVPLCREHWCTCHRVMGGGFIMGDLGVTVCVTLVDGHVVAVRVSCRDVPLGVHIV
jgi:hypothetical protein